MSKSATTIRIAELKAEGLSPEEIVRRHPKLAQAAIEELVPTPVPRGTGAMASGPTSGRMLAGILFC